MFRKSKFTYLLILSLVTSLVLGTNCVSAESLDSKELELNETTLNKLTTIELDKTSVELNKDNLGEDNNTANKTISQDLTPFETNLQSSQPSRVIWSYILDDKAHETENNIQNTADGGYIIASTTKSDLILLAKIDANGNMQWAYSYGNGYKWEVNGVSQTNDGGYILTGKVNDDVFLIKIDSNGSAEWNKLFGGEKSDYGSDVVQTTDGGYFIIGSSLSFGNGDYQAYVIKTDANGEGEWGGTLPGNGTKYGKEALIEPSTGNIIVRTYNIPGGRTTIDLLKINNTGTITQSKTYYADTIGLLPRIIITTDGGLILTGGIAKEAMVKDSKPYVSLAKLDSTFNIEWQKKYYVDGYNGFQYGRAVYQTNDNGFIIAGIVSENEFNYNADLGLIKVNSSGVAEWIQTFSIKEYDTPYFVHQTSDNGYVIGGWAQNRKEEFSGTFILNLR